MIRTVDSTADVSVTVTAAMRHLCPFVNEVDNGHITITWAVAGQTIELHSLRAYLDGFAESSISHEQLTDRVRHDLALLPGVDIVEVGSSWDTAGMGVSCVTSLTLPLTGSVPR